MTWLSNRPILNSLLALAYYLLVVLPHEAVGRMCARLLDEPLGRAAYNQLVLVCGAAVLLAYLFVLVKNVRKRPELAVPVFGYFAATLLLALLSFKLLIVIHVEVVHFVQYAVMALLLFPLVKRYGETAFWATLLGAADEAWQYFYLAPERTNYYDFNDVVINLLGAAFGLVLVRSAQPGFALPRRRAFWRSPVAAATLTLAGLLFLFFKMEWLHLYPPSDGSGALWSLVRVPPEGFWTTVHPDVTFHVMQPLEGVVTVVLLLLFYSGLDR